MLIRWIIRILFICGFVAVAASAEQRQPVKNNPPPRQNPNPPAGQGKPDPNPGPGQGRPNPNPPPGTIVGPAPGAPVQNNNPNNPPANNNPTPRDPRQDHDRRHTRNQPVIVIPNWLYSTYPWNGWYDSYAGWWRPDDYNDGSDYRRDGRDEPVANDVARDNRPADQPTPAQDQARAQNQLEGTPAFQQATVELKKAQSDYDRASQRVLEALKKNNADYRALLDQRDALADRVETQQAKAVIPSPEKVTPVAKEKLDLSSRITRMEQDAIANDREASDAKARLVEWTAKVSALRKAVQAP